MRLNKIGLVRFFGIVMRAGRLPDAWFCNHCNRWHSGRTIRYSLPLFGQVRFDVCYRCLESVGEEAASETDRTTEEVIAEMINSGYAFVGEEPVTKLARMEARRRAELS